MFNRLISFCKSVRSISMDVVNEKYNVEARTRRRRAAGRMAGEEVTGYRRNSTYYACKYLLDSSTVRRAVTCGKGWGGKGGEGIECCT